MELEVCINKRLDEKIRMIVPFMFSKLQQHTTFLNGINIIHRMQEIIGKELRGEKLVCVANIHFDVKEMICTVVFL